MVEKEEKPSSSVNPQISSSNLDSDATNCEEISPYEKKYFALLARCEIIKQCNERLVNRIYHVKKLLRRRKKERKFLMERLDSYGDDYRTVSLQLFADVIGDIEGITDPSQNSNTTKKEIPQTLSSQMDMNL